MYTSRDMIIRNNCIKLYNHEHNIRQYVHFHCLILKIPESIIMKLKQLKYITVNSNRSVCVAVSG